MGVKQGVKAVSRVNLFFIGSVNEPICSMFAGACDGPLFRARGYVGGRRRFGTKRILWSPSEIE